MNEIPKSNRSWRIVRRILITLAVLATLTAIFYTEEDWRGKRAWEQCRQQLEAQGVVLDWNAYIPPPVPDAQNIFKAPKMQEWFVKGVVKGNRTISFNHSTNELSGLSTNGLTTAVITNETVAANYLKWSGQFQPKFDQLREALKRPYARMDGDYSKPYEIPIANFGNERAVAQVLAQRAKCGLLLGQPDQALNDLTLLNNSRRLMERAPAGKPITLVDAMIDVAVTGLYADTIAKGLQSHVWKEPQLAALQKQLEQINLLPIVAQSFGSEPAATTRALETVSTAKLREWFSPVGEMKWALIPQIKSTLIPRGWIYQNMATSARLVCQQTEGCDPVNNLIQPRKFGDLTREFNAIAWPYKFIVADSIPNFTRAWQTTAHNQTMVNEAQIACALERYHLAHNEYPETLDALVPQFIQKLPHDIIGGQPSQGSGSTSQPLHYRRTADGKFLLYSVGWNEMDDGGEPGTLFDPTHGDWVLKN
ncbi:MAG: hypothetical protein ACREDQ_06325 [Limisphaerales bacterium]